MSISKPWWAMASDRQLYMAHHARHIRIISSRPEQHNQHLDRIGVLDGVQVPDGGRAAEDAVKLTAPPRQPGLAVRK